MFGPKNVLNMNKFWLGPDKDHLHEYTINLVGDVESSEFLDYLKDTLKNHDGFDYRFYFNIYTYKHQDRFELLFTKP